MEIKIVKLFEVGLCTDNCACDLLRKLAEAQGEELALRNADLVRLLGVIKALATENRALRAALAVRN